MPLLARHHSDTAFRRNSHLSRAYMNFFGIINSQMPHAVICALNKLFVIIARITFKYASDS
jgi:hypothetical protein